MTSETDSRVSNDSNKYEPYQLHPITSGASSTNSHQTRNSISRIRSSTSEVTRILTAIRDDHQQDNEEYEQYRDQTDLDEILDAQLEFTSRKSTRDEESRGADHGEFDKEEEVKEEEAGDEDDDEPPDGGYAWVTAICALMAVFATWGANAGYGVFLNFYISSEVFPESTPYDFALIGGLVVFLAQALAPFSALAYKVFGFYTLCYAGVVVQLCGYILASFATKLWQIYLTQGVLIGVSFLMIFIPSTLILPTYFKKYRAFAMGIAVSGAGLGGIAFSLSVSKLIQQTGDQRWPLRMCGIVTFVLATIATSLNKPRNYKPLPYSTTLTAKFLKDNCRIIFDYRIFKSYPLCLLGCWFLLCLLGYTLMLFSTAAYASLVGLSTHSASILTALLNTGQLLGRPTLGLVADRAGRNNLASGVCLLLSILLWAFWINATTFSSLAAFSVILGFFIGIGSLMCQSLAADILQAPEKIPAAWSFLNIFVLFFCLVSEVIAFAIRDEKSAKPFLNTQIFSGCCFFVAAMLLLIIREWLVRRTLSNRLQTANMGIASLEKKRHGYLNVDDLQNSESEVDESNQEIDILYARRAKYEKLLSRSVIYFFVRMLYPIRV